MPRSLPGLGAPSCSRFLCSFVQSILSTAPAADSSRSANHDPVRRLDLYKALLLEGGYMYIQDSQPFTPPPCEAAVWGRHLHTRFVFNGRQTFSGCTRGDVCGNGCLGGRPSVKGGSPGRMDRDRRGSDECMMCMHFHCYINASTCVYGHAVRVGCVGAAGPGRPCRML